jgi:hypothetical protein
MIQKVLTAVLFLTIFSAKAQIHIHKNAGINYHYISGTAVSANYNLRLNLFGANNWRIGLALNPHVGAGLDSKISNDLFPFVMIPVNLEYHQGMGSSFDVLRYKGIGIRGGGTIYNLANFDVTDALQQGVLLGGDYKFQNKNLNTFSVQFNAIYPISGNLDFLMATLGLNYHFGLY